MAACMPFIAALPHAADHFSFVTRGGGGGGFGGGGGGGGVLGWGGGGGFVGGVAGVMDYWFSGMMVAWAGMWACGDLQGILA